MHFRQYFSHVTVVLISIRGWRGNVVWYFTCMLFVCIDCRQSHRHVDRSLKYLDTHPCFVYKNMQFVTMEISTIRNIQPLYYNWLCVVFDCLFVCFLYFNHNISNFDIKSQQFYFKYLTIFKILLNIYELRMYSTILTGLTWIEQLVSQMPLYVFPTAV